MKKSLILLLVIVISGCLPPIEIPPIPSATETMEPTPSSTVEWFPPTPAVVITPTNPPRPTPGISSEVGEILFEDDFFDPEPWTVPQTDRGQINIGEGELNIIIYEPKTFLIGTREKPDFQNFYAEISANPILCSAEDEYGFLFKVIGREQYYRFAVTCGGFVRLDTIIGEGGTILYPWTRSGSLPSGAPSKSKLAVLVYDDQISLFINGDRQLTVTDQQIKIGSFGVYARSVTDSAVTVSFSNLIIREVLLK